MRKHLRQIGRWGLLLLLGTLTVSSPAFAETNLHLRVLPLECSVDTLNSGVNVLMQVSPSCASLEQLQQIDLSALDRSGIHIDQPVRGTTTSFASSDRLFYMQIPTGYDSAYAYQTQTAPRDDYLAMRRYVDALIPVVVVMIAVVAATTLIAQNSLGGFWLRRLLNKVRTRGK